MPKKGIIHPHSREGCVVIEHTNYLGHFHQTDYVTINFSFWDYIIPRAALTIVEGLHKDEEVQEIAQRGKLDSKGAAQQPRFISFTCRAEDLVNFAKEIIKTHEKPLIETDS